VRAQQLLCSFFHVREGVILPEKLSLATFYRFLARHPELAAGKDPENQGDKELKRFSRQWVNDLWQSDMMFGPYLKVGKSKKQTYLFAFIDDASRLVTHAQFSFSQNYTTMRAVLKEAVLKEAVLKRGVPKMIYTDNGKVYRNGQLAMLCAGLGCSLIHAEPFTPNSKGKIERFFHTVRQRFLVRVDPTKLRDIDELNLHFWQWLESDYQRKTHSSLDMSPLDFFMSQASKVNLMENLLLLEELFLLRVMRKVNHDATLSIDTILYETDQTLANSRVEVRYEPEWLTNPAQPLFLFRDGLKVGEARQVNFHDNSYVKRKGPGRPSEVLKEQGLRSSNPSESVSAQVSSISFASFREEKSSKIREQLPEKEGDS